jgi:hypothetical protein
MNTNIIITRHDLIQSPRASFPTDKWLIINLSPTLPPGNFDACITEPYLDYATGLSLLHAIYLYINNIGRKNALRLLGDAVGVDCPPVRDFNPRKKRYTMYPISPTVAEERYTVYPTIRRPTATNRII